MTETKKTAEFAIWGFALGYFLCYVPYSSLTKAITGGKLSSVEEPIRGFQLLPLSVTASMIGMLIFITVMGWWKYAGRRTVLGRSIPSPGRWTFLSGICTAGVIGTTTMAYTFEGVSIVFMMLLMRGGVLIMAPIVDFLSKRHVRWFSWAAVALSLGALVVAFAEDGGFHLKLVATIDIMVYLGSYFVRLRFMSRLAKSEDLNARTRYFVEEQMVASPFLVLTLVVLALIDHGTIMHAVRSGFVDVVGSAALPYVILIGVLSQGTGIFGSLIFLDKRENTFCVPVNRSSSIMAGIIAMYSLYFFLGGAKPSSYQLGGAALIIGAIVFLTLPPLMQRRRSAQTVGATS